MGARGQMDRALDLKGRIVQPPKTGLKCTSAAAPTLQQTVACQSCPLRSEGLGFNSNSDFAVTYDLEGLGFNSHYWSCAEVSGKFLIPYCLCPPSSNGHLVE